MVYLRKWFFFALIILVISSVYQQKMNFIATSPEKNPVNNNSETEDASVLSSPAHCFYCHNSNFINSSDNIPPRLLLIHPFLEGASILMSLVSAVVIIVVVVSRVLEGAYLLIGVVAVVFTVVVDMIYIIKRCSLGKPSKKLEDFREELGEWVLLGLQILILAEVLSTIIIPSWNKLGILAATIAIRLVMVYFTRIEKINLYGDS
jgi:uncharacterized membrane protein